MKKGLAGDYGCFAMADFMAFVIIICGILAVIFAFSRDFLISL